MRRSLLLLSVAACGLTVAAPVSSQESPARSAIPNADGNDPSRVPEQMEGQDSSAARVTITGNIVEPVATKPNAERIAALDLPDGFSIDIFAEDLGNARMIEVSEDGTVYVTRRQEGDVIMLKDEDGDGRADAEPQIVASFEGMHDLVLDGDTAWLVAVNDLFRAEIAEDGTLGELETVADDLPDGGQHPNRTLILGPDGAIYLSAGSTCNACAETSDESATMLRFDGDGPDRSIFASGLRNTIGFGFHPETDALWGFDHGIDWLGDDEQPEEFNLIAEGKSYGWPYIYADSQINPQDDPVEETMEDWLEKNTDPVLMYTPHAAPMQMAFNPGGDFPDEYSGDAFVAMRGSWNRSPPSGYEVVRVRFADGEPQEITPFVTGFLSGEGDDFQQMGRLAGLAFLPDGSMLFTDDQNGVLYRVSHEGE